jgi:hypothetical protein
MKIALFFWIFVLAGLIVMVGIIEVVFLRGNRNEQAPSINQTNPFSVFIASGTWLPFYRASNIATFGTVKIDNSSFAQNSVQRAVPGLDVESPYVYGQLQLAGLEFTWPTGTLPFLIFQESKNASFVQFPCNPVGRTSPQGQLLFFGTYSCLFGASPFGPAIDFSNINTTTFYILAVAIQLAPEVRNSTTLGIIMTSAFVGPVFNTTTKQLKYAILGIAPMSSGNNALKSNGTVRRCCFLCF